MKTWREVLVVLLVVAAFGVGREVGVRIVPPPEPVPDPVDVLADAVLIRFGGLYFWCVDGPDPPRGVRIFQ